jgi:hypothetical protein
MAIRRKRDSDVEELVTDEYRAVIESSSSRSVGSVVLPPPSTPATTTTPRVGGPEHRPALITLEVWLISSGMKPDQTAGFRRFARTRKLAARTAPEWMQAYREFSSRLV